MSFLLGPLLSMVGTVAGSAINHNGNKLSGAGLAKYKCKNCGHDKCAPGGSVSLTSDGHLHHTKFCVGCGLMDHISLSRLDSESVMRYIQDNLLPKIRDIAEINHPGTGEIITSLFHKLMNAIYPSANKENYEGKGFGVSCNDPQSDSDEERDEKKIEMDGQGARKMSYREFSSKHMKAGKKLKEISKLWKEYNK